ncbi:MAG: hypothetical protein M3463_12400 [Verrucomicrobiota bacterium]|nr:hypothetical protein [Verrucomicrobiota bacterium]
MTAVRSRSCGRSNFQVVRAERCVAASGSRKLCRKKSTSQAACSSFRISAVMHTARVSGASNASAIPSQLNTATQPATPSSSMVPKNFGNVSEALQNGRRVST